MRIALFMCSVLEQGGGLEKYFINLANYFSGNKDIEMDVVTLDENFTKNLNLILSFYYLKNYKDKPIYNESTKNILTRLGKSKYIKCKNFGELREVLKKYDLIYSKNELVEAFIFKFIVGYRNIPKIVFGVHTPHFYPYTRSITSKLHNILYLSPLYNWLTSGVSMFHVSNKQSKEVISKQIPHKKVELIYYPFDIDRFIKHREQHHPEKKRKKNTVNITWVARLTEQKGVEDLVNIINHVNASSAGDKIMWHIAGEGELKSEIISLQKKWPNTKYHGFIENIKVPDLLLDSDLFISTSKWEVSPFNILEAQSCGLPVISFKIAGPEDIIIEKVTGITVSSTENFIREIKRFVDGKYKFIDPRINIRNKFDPEKIYKELCRKIFYG